jgi:hypothetical protein
MEFKKDLEIDKWKLDEEWVGQAQLYAAYATKAVEKAYERDKAREYLDLTKAELDTEIRKDPSKYGIEKVSESAISNAILQQSKYKKASGDYLLLIKETKIFEVARDSFDHRKKALEKLTDLFLSNYWADRDLRKAEDKKDDLGYEQLKRKMASNPRLRKIKEEKGD